MKHYKDADGKIYAFEEDGSQDHLIVKGLTAISQKKVDETIEIKKQESFDSLTYAQKRANEYPSIGDQLDALFHAGAFPKELADQIQSIKDKYPKV